MKKRLFGIVCIVVILASFVFAQSDDEIAINYRSAFGEYKLDLVKYLGYSSEGYEFNDVQNVTVSISTSGTATINPKLGWKGSEVVLFRRIGGDSDLGSGESENGTDKGNQTFFTGTPKFEIAEGFELPANIGIINDDLMNKTLAAFLDGSFSELVLGIEKENLTTITKSKTENDVQLKINGDISIFLKNDKSADFKINLNLGGEKDIIIPEDEENFAATLRNYFILGFFLIGTGLFLAIKRYRKKNKLHGYKWKIPVLGDEKEKSRRTGVGIVSTREEAQEKIKKILRRKK